MLICTLFLVGLRAGVWVLWNEIFRLWVNSWSVSLGVVELNDGISFRQRSFYINHYRYFQNFGYFQNHCNVYCCTLYLFMRTKNLENSKNWVSAYVYHTRGIQWWAYVAQFSFYSIEIEHIDRTLRPLFVASRVQECSRCMLYNVTI